MTKEVSKTCLICSDAENLIPLFTERTPTAQPAAYIHMDCLIAWRDTPSSEEVGNSLLEELNQLLPIDKSSKR
jgi:hypothetical protein